MGSHARLSSGDKIVAVTFHQNVPVSPDCLIGTPEISDLLAAGRMK
jgi:hypothetical protein